MLQSSRVTAIERQDCRFQEMKDGDGVQEKGQERARALPVAYEEQALGRIGRSSRKRLHGGCPRAGLAVDKDARRGGVSAIKQEGRE
jgi:hypothetical protein